MSSWDDTHFRELFDGVAQKVRDTPERKENLSSPTQKLHLYGLYKHVTSGKSLNSEQFSIFQVAERSKSQAWKDCSHLTTREAMEEYVECVCNRQDSLGQECRELRSKFLARQETSSDAKKATRPESNDTTPDSSTESGNNENVGRGKVAPGSSVFPTTDTPVSTKMSSVDSSNLFRQIWSFLSSYLCALLGIRPLLPRGRLDISYSDLFFAFGQSYKFWESVSQFDCLQIKQQIVDLWKEQADQDVVVGLSLRSLFDLYLSTKKFPPGSEVILVPFITVPGMIQVMKHHRLKMVPVDLNGNSWVDMPALKAAITSRTVAIVVVHPFGMLAANQEQFTDLRTLADSHSLELWEDCAECFEGLGKDGYLGSPDADVRFFSFGMIKTATALGGGVASFRDPEAQVAVQHLQRSLHGRQSTRQFFFKVVLSTLLRFAGETEWRAGFVAAACSWFGIDFDRAVTRALRGFHSQEAFSCSVSARVDMMRQMRQEPSKALLTLLLRRLKQSDSVLRSIRRRRNQCDQVKALLSGSEEICTLPITSAGIDTYWLFPIVCQNRDAVSRILRKSGIDAASGTSQLCCVSSYDTEQPAAPATESLMDSILYLPVAGQALPQNELNRIATTVKTALRRSKLTEKNQKEHGSLRWYLICWGVPALAFACRRFSSTDIFVSVLFCGQLVVQSSIVMAISVVVGLHFLRLAVSALYLNKSSAVAENSDLVDLATSQGLKNPSQPRPERILSRIEAIDLKGLESETKPVGGRTVVLTGGTGFIGSLLLRDLLHAREKLSLCKVIVLCRSKRGNSATQRIQAILDKQMFDFLTAAEKTQYVEVIEANLTHVNAGINDLDLSRLKEDSSVTHLIHCAASVNFTQELPDIAETNITTSLMLQDVLSQFTNKSVRFVYISTAFVHGGSCGSKDSPLPEELFPLGPYDATEIYKSMLGTQHYASQAMMQLRFPNTYSFSKCVCEHLLVQRKDVETVIIRPSIVGPSVECPFEGWSGEKPSTIVGGACLHLTQQWNFWCLKDNLVAYVPVDVLSRFVIAKAFQGDIPSIEHVDSGSSDGSFERISSCSEVLSEMSEATQQRETAIYNATWDSASSEASAFTWLQFSVGYFQLGRILNYFDGCNALLTLLVSGCLSPKICNNFETHKRLHQIIVHGPINLVIKVMEAAAMSTKEIRQVLPFLDLPSLFYPFVSESFYFKSDLKAPASFDPQRYVCGIAAAAHRFLAEKEEKKESLSAMLIGGRAHTPLCSDFWWSLSQPIGDYAVRLCGWMFAKILRHVCLAVTVDVPSFRHIISTLKKTDDEKPHYLILAPTHRSFFDFILLSYVFFSIPELQVDIPHIIAASDFEQLPLIGWLAKMLRAFYIQRGRGTKDERLGSGLRQLKTDYLGKNGSCIEVFIEGTRSRDRRFVKPKTGFMKSLTTTGGEHVVVPITINYDRLPEQHNLTKQASDSARSEMNLSSLWSWLIDVFHGKVNLGNIHIVASQPLHMKCKTKPEFEQFGEQIQVQQQRKVVISNYHIGAVGKLVNTPPEETKAALTSLGCKLWPGIQSNSNACPDLPSDSSELWTVLLQISPHLAPLFYDSHPRWSKWLNHASREGYKVEGESETLHQLRDALARSFDLADEAVTMSIDKLRQSGFSTPRPMHVFQMAHSEKPEVPKILIQAAVDAISSSLEASKPESDMETPVALISQMSAKQQFEGVERLGFWGFEDSGFMLMAGKSKSRVTMTGSRYTLCGRSVTKLLPFIEKELQVRFNPRNEFPTQSPVWSTDVTSNLSDGDKEFLVEGFQKFSFSTAERTRHGTGHSQEDVFAIRNGSNLRIPDAVVWPQSDTEVKKLIQSAVKQNWCLIPFGGGTNVSNATRCPSLEVEPRPIISVDMKDMKRILWLNESDGLACIEAGITGRDLVDELAERGYTMGHEPDSIEFSTLGGWIATKASGMKRSRYGNIEDIVMSARVVTSNGILWKGNPDDTVVPGRVAEGLDVRSLIMGSEGCLGIVTSAVVRIWPLPEVRAYDSVVFPSFEDGLKFVRGIAKTTGISPASVRLLDNAHFRLGQALRPDKTSVTGQLGDAITRLATSVLHANLKKESVVCATICYEGGKDEVAVQQRLVQRLARENCGIQLGATLGKAGYELTFMIAYLRDFAMTYHMLGESFETFVPWSKIEVLIAKTKERIVEEHKARLLPGLPFVGCRVTQLYHEGACLYFYLCFGFEGVPNASDVFSALEHAAREEVLRYGGSLSHHHGIGKHRAEQLQNRNSDALKESLLQVKKGIDSNNVFGARNGAFASC